MFRCLLSLVFCVVSSSVLLAALSIDGYTSSRHDRFLPDGSGGLIPQGSTFIGSTTVTGFSQPLDLSGVGRGAWATAISPTHYLTANHAKPSGAVTFYDDTTAEAYMQCTVNPSGGARVFDSADTSSLGTDLFVGEFSTCVNVNGSTKPLTFYSLASSSTHFGDVAFNIGVGSSTHNFRVGRNVVSAVSSAGNPLFPLDDQVGIDFGSGPVPHFGDWAYYMNDAASGDVDTSQLARTGDLAPATAGDSSTISDETYFQGGDSGGPTFIFESGEWKLMGIHSFTNAEFTFATDESGNPGSDNRRASGDNLVATLAPEINAIAVPEPSPSLLLSVAFLLVGLRQYRVRLTAN